MHKGHFSMKILFMGRKQVSANLLRFL